MRNLKLKLHSFEFHKDEIFQVSMWYNLENNLIEYLTGYNICYRSSGRLIMRQSWHQVVLIGGLIFGIWGNSSALKGVYNYYTTCNVIIRMTVLNTTAYKINILFYDFVVKLATNKVRKTPKMDHQSYWYVFEQLLIMNVKHKN